MNKDKVLSIFSTVLAVGLSNLMSARIAIEYCNRRNSIKYEGVNEPTNSILIIVIPYIIMILATL